MIWLDNIPIIIESSLILIMGILMLLYFAVLYRNHYNAYRNAILFISAIALSSCIWIGSISSLPQILTTNSAGVSMMIFYSYMVLPVFEILFFNEMISDRYTEFMHLLSIYMVILFATVCSCGLGITSLYEVLPVNHVFCSVLTVFILYYAIMEYRRRHNKNILWLIFSFSVMTVGSVSDLVVYYFYPVPDITRPYRIGLMVLLLLLTMTTIRASLRQFSDLRAARYYKRLAYVDRVTGGRTRQRFADSIGEIPDDGDHWFIHLNILHFRIINEAFGREKCDSLLYLIYRTCEANLRTDEMICNLGDSCMGFYLRAADEKALRVRINEFDAMIRHCVMTTLGGPVAQIEFCIYKVEETGKDLDRMLDYALMARRNKDAEFWQEINGYVYSEKCRQHLLADKELENMLEEALKNQEIQPYLQPKVTPWSGTVKGAEALARWISPAHGMIMPSVFIPLFEKNGMISQIDLSIFEQVCVMIQDWVKQGLTPPVVSVNISKAAIQYDDFFEKYLDIMQRTQVAPQYLEFELTESVAYDNMERIRSILDRIHRVGARCSMDDFGKSYSNLNALGNLPFDTVKMDKCFFDDGFPEDVKKTMLVSDTMKLLKDIRMEVVMEGIETEEQVRALGKMGGDLIQGFYFSAPLSREKFEKYWLENC